MHNSGDVFDQPKCHAKTRITVLRTIMQWIQSVDGQSSSMLWLYGTTGVGKTVIARSIAEHCEELGLLLASFFFSRTVQGRNSTKQFISTIAYQLAQTIPTTLKHIEGAIEKDPSIFDKTLKHQVQTLIVHPLKLANNLPKTSPTHLKLSTPYLLVIDGLDECDDVLAHIQILKILGSLILQHELPLKILIVTRPERHIRSSFETGSLSKLATTLAVDDSDDDIRLFLSSEFDEFKESHPFRSTIPKNWPHESMIQVLVKKSAGQFIFAAAVIKFVASFDHSPPERLEDILALCDDDTPDRILEFLDERRISPHSLDSDLPNSHVSKSFSATWNFSSSSSDNKDHHPLRRRTASPFPSHLSNTEEVRRASSEPSFDRTAGRLWRSTSGRVNHSATHYSCPIPGCGAIFTRHLNFKVHLRTHKEEQQHSRCYRSSSPSTLGYSRAFIKQRDRKRRGRDLDLLPCDHIQSFRCGGCKRQFPQMDALDRHLKSEIGVECRKVVESSKAMWDVLDPSTTGDQHCWEMDMDMEVEVEVEVEVDKGIGTTEMEVD